MQDLICIGRLTKPHGLRGDLVFLPYVYDSTLLPDLVQRQVFLRQSAAPLASHTVHAWQMVHKRILVQFQGCKDVNAAEALRTAEVFIPRAWFPRLPDGEYYWFEIEGLAVYDKDAYYLGTVAEIMYTGSNDVYVVRHDDQEHLVPALRSVVRTIDLAQGTIHLSIAAEMLV